MSLDQLTVEEKSLICQTLIAAGLRQPKWEALINSTLGKMGLTELAEEIFSHYKTKAIIKQVEGN